MDQGLHRASPLYLRHVGMKVEGVMAAPRRSGPLDEMTTAKDCHHGRCAQLWTQETREPDDNADQ